MFGRLPDDLRSLLADVLDFYITTSKDFVSSIFADTDLTDICAIIELEEVLAMQKIVLLSKSGLLHNNPAEQVKVLIDCIGIYCDAVADSDTVWSNTKIGELVTYLESVKE
jgi:hypothetical protein